MSLRESIAQLKLRLEESLHRHRSLHGEPTDHARGWYNAYENLIGDLAAALANDDDLAPHDTAEKRAMRSAVAWYVTFLERERDNRG